MTRHGRAELAWLDPKVLAGVGDLQWVARVTVDGTLSGLHRSPFHGYSAEFSQYRQYRPGDDLKYVDWKLFARTDRVFTRQYLETTNLGAQILIDASGSMAHGGGRGVAKIAYARLLAAALTHLLASQGDAIGLTVFDEKIRTYLPARSGAAHSRTVLLALAQLSAAGRTRSTDALRRSIDLMRRRGLVVLITDLYDDERLMERELKRAVRIGHEVVVFHLVTREETEFPFDTAVTLEDLESGRRIVVDGGARPRYAREFEAFVQGWRRRCTAAAIDYATIRTDTPLDAALRAYLVKRPRAATR